jgi:hypothetical protein
LTIKIKYDSNKQNLILLNKNYSIPNPNFLASRQKIAKALGNEPQPSINPCK